MLPTPRNPARTPHVRAHSGMSTTAPCASACLCLQAPTTPPTLLPTRPGGRGDLLQFPVVIQQQPLVISPFDFFLPLLI